MTWKIKPLTKALCLFGLTALMQAAYAHTYSLENITKTDSQEDDIPSAVVSGAENDTVTLGTAYNTQTKGFYTVPAVLGSIDDSYGNTEMDLTVGVDIGYSQLADMLDGSLGASLNVPAVSASIGASYAKAHAADNYTGTYTLFLSLKPKKKLLVPNDGSGFQPTQGALDIVNANPGNKFADIGDEFLSVIEYGSQIMVNLKFEYKNAEDKVKWGGQLNVDWIGKIEVNGALNSVNNSVKRDIKVTVSAIQMGGDENRILSVIPNEIVKCTMENPQPCFDIFSNTITYMKTDYINQFSSLADYNVVRLYTDKYKTSGPGLKVLLPDGDYPTKSLLTKLAIKNMSENWVQSTLDIRRASNLLNYYAADLSNADRNALQKITTDALLNAGLWAEAVGYCNANPFGNYCRNRELQTQGYIVAYDRQLLE